MLVDEAHMIGETKMGGCLELVIGRMKTIQRAACVRTLTGLIQRLLLRGEDLCLCCG